MKGLDSYITDLLQSALGISDSLMPWIYPLAVALVIAATSYICTTLFRLVITPAIQKVARKTKTKWDDYLFDKSVMRAFRRIIPPVIWYAMLPLMMTHTPALLTFLQKCSSIYLVIVTLRFANTVTDSLYEISEKHDKLRNRPLKGIHQTFKLLAIIVGLILIVSIVIDKSAVSVLAGLGASAAVLMLIFKDAILGLVAGVQLSANDMLRPGDWVTLEKYGANGFVIEVSLIAVKVQNFDKSITTIPPYAFVSESFRNWRPMREAGVRRMKLSIYVDANTVRFCDAAEIRRFVSKGYLPEGKYADTAQPIANTQIFRDYMIDFLGKHPDVSKDVIMAVRMLQPTPEGLPLEIYCYSTFTDWPLFESFQGKILDYAIVMAQEFGLRIFQRPAGKDFKTV